MKRLLSMVLAVCMMFSCIIAADYISVDVQAATEYSLAENVQDGQILQCFNWSFNNIKNNMAKIAEQGFSAIQTSPIQSSKESTKESWSTCSNAFWVYYQPINYSIETNSRSALGTKSEFKAMCDEAHKYGVKVIVDAVFNHLANDNADNTKCSQIPSDIRDDSSCWHSVTTNISNYSDRYDITHHCLAGLPDLNTGSSKIQNYSISFLKECIDAGADGFRFDAAKHIETPSDYSGTSSDFWPNVLSAATSYAQSTRGITPYYYGEMLDSTGGVDISAYTNYMSVTDNGGSNSIRNAVNSSNAGGAANSAIFNGAQPKNTVQWNESHDTYCEGSSSYVSDTNLKKTWALVGSRAEVCGMYLARPSSGSTKLGEADVTAWADKEVKAINQFKNAFVGQTEYFASSGSIAYNERGTSGVVLVNTGGSSTSVNVTANRMASGTYTDAISGNKFTVSGGRISGSIGSTGIAVVYNPSEIVVPTSTATTAPTVALSGETKTVYVGVIEYITSTPTLHYWNSTGLEGDAKLVATGETAKYAVGADYWSNAQQTFNIYKATIPVEATNFKTYDASTNSNWAQEEITYAEDTITLVFEWSNLYHNQSATYVIEQPTQAPTQEPTEAPTQAPTQEPTLSSETKTVYVGVIKYITEPQTLHYWNYNSLSGDAQLVSTGETQEFSVGSSYWSNAAKTFYIYKAEIPADATHMKTYDASTNSNWAEESVEYADGKILLVFEWSDLYHNQLHDYTVEEPTVEPTVEPTEAPTQEPTQEPTEAPTQAPTEAPQPIKVENITFNAEATTILFNWDEVKDGEKYWIYKYDESTDSWGAPIISAYTGTAVVKNLKPNTTYQFKINCRLTNKKYLSLDDADIIEVTTKPADAPKTITGQEEAIQVTLNWDAVEGATKYWVYKATSPEGPYSIHNSSRTNSLLVKYLKPDTDYYFRVTSMKMSNGINTISAVDDSPTCHIKTLSADLVTTRATQVNANTAKIEWTQYKNADKYWVWISETTSDTSNTDEWKVLQSFTDTSVTEYTYTNLSKATTYFLTISVRYYTDDGTMMITEYFPVQIMTRLSDEDIFTFEPVDDTTLKVTWDESLDVEKSWVFVYDEEGNHLMNPSTLTNTVTISKLNDMKNYTYHLRVRDHKGFYGYVTPPEGEKYHE